MFVVAFCSHWTSNRLHSIYTSHTNPHLGADLRLEPQSDPKILWTFDKIFRGYIKKGGERPASREYAFRLHNVPAHVPPVSCTSRRSAELIAWIWSPATVLTPLTQKTSPTPNCLLLTFRRSWRIILATTTWPVSFYTFHGTRPCRLQINLKPLRTTHLGSCGNNTPSIYWATPGMQ